MDTRTPEQRRRIMSSVRTKHTGPEMVVRQLLHRLGFRFRIHRRSLAGSPDIVLPKHRAAIFVHGCFWHGHGCSKGRLPKSRLDYWSAKVEANKRRDANSREALELSGWKVLTIWQCETRDLSTIERRISARLTMPRSPRES
ncbi:MAG TPA: very short patch repair endonuclease [Caulobacteraceae bacterium]